MFLGNKGYFHIAGFKKVCEINSLTSNNSFIINAFGHMNPEPNLELEWYSGLYFGYNYRDRL